MQRSTEELTRRSTGTLAQEVVENGGNATRTEKIMSVCRKIVRWMHMLDLVLVVSVIMLLGILEFNIGPCQQIGFFCNDPKISFKFKGDTVSMGLLLGCCIAAPLIVMYIVEYVCHSADSYDTINSNGSRNGGTRTRQIWSWYHHYSMGFATLVLMCAVIKILIGEPRPHFLDTCKPQEAINCTDEYINSYTCTNTENSDWFIKDSSKSFPSGHSALSVYTSIFLVWYLQNRLSNRTLFLKPWLQCLMSMWAVTCSMTRVSDRRHHWWDVLAGVIIGFLFGLFVVVVSCQHFRLRHAMVVHTFNESPENGQIISYDKLHKHGVRKLLTSAVDVSEGREMKAIVTTWKE